MAITSCQRLPGCRHTRITQQRDACGGNLCQDVRCSYYRYPHQIGGRIICARKDGPKRLAVTGDNRYHALQGKQCFAVCPLDMAAALTCLNAAVNITGPGGDRSIPVPDLYTAMGNTLKTGESITGINIPRPAPGCRQIFFKFTVFAGRWTLP